MREANQLYRLVKENEIAKDSKGSKKAASAAQRTVEFWARLAVNSFPLIHLFGQV